MPKQPVKRTRKQPVKRTRKVKTPKQRAEETLAVAERRVADLEKKRTAAHEEFERLNDALVRASRRLHHAQANPDLHDEDDTELPFGDAE